MFQFLYGPIKIKPFIILAEHLFSFNSSMVRLRLWRKLYGSWEDMVSIPLWSD